MIEWLLVKVLVKSVINLVISVNISESVLDDSQADYFYASKFGE